MQLIATCPLCQEILHPIEYIASVYFLHMIDAHWDRVERIHATTGDADARSRLVAELEAERYPETQN